MPTISLTPSVATADALLARWAARCGPLAAVVHLPDEIFDVALEVEPADDDAGDDGNHQARADVERRDPPAKQTAQSMITATSLTSGAAIRNEKVTPSGMPDSTKPIKSGTAEQEQKGVTMPRVAASTLPIPWRLPPNSAACARR